MKCLKLNKNVPKIISNNLFKDKNKTSTSIKTFNYYTNSNFSTLNKNNTLGSPEELKLQKEKDYTNNSGEKSFKNFDPDSEILKFYNKYMYDDKNTSKEDYETLFKSKLEYIDKKNSELKEITGENKNSYIKAKINKFSGILEYKSQLEEILQIITNRISNAEEDNLKELAEYYFKQSGKMIRPYLLISISKYMFECIFTEETHKEYFNSVIHKRYVLPFSASVEVLHNASLLHDDIIDDSEMRRSHTTAHNVFGIRDTVFGANYIISKAANVVIDLEVKNLNEIYASMVYYLTYGECKQSLNKSNLDDIDTSFKVYMIKTYYKTASLIALGLRGVGSIYDLDLHLQKKLFDLGLHIGIVFQLIDDVMDVLFDSGKMKKPALKDLKEGIVNSHILFEIEDANKLGLYGDDSILQLAKRKFKNEGDIQKVIEVLNCGKGIIKTQNLALDHLIECYKILDDPFFKNTLSKSGLYQCFSFLINRNY